MSHVEIVAKALAGDAVPLLFESTTLATEPCLITGKRTSGVQAHDLDQRIQQFPGRVWHYPLTRKLRIVQSIQLTDFCIHHVNAGTGYDALEAFRSRATPLGWLERLLLRSPENLSRLFCSEFVAAAWKECEVWNAPNASRWSPNAIARSAVRTGIVAARRSLK